MKLFEKFFTRISWIKLNEKFTHFDIPRNSKNLNFGKILKEIFSNAILSHICEYSINYLQLFFFFSIFIQTFKIRQRIIGGMLEISMKNLKNFTTRVFYEPPIRDEENIDKKGNLRIESWKESKSTKTAGYGYYWTKKF